MSRGADFFEREKERKRQEALDSGLARAVANRDVAVARELLDQGASPRAPSTSGWPMLVQVANAIGLHRSGARERSEQIFTLLLERGADPNQATGSGQTALHAAAYYSLSPQARQLLERGAEARARDAEGCEPAHVVGSGGGAYGAKEWSDPVGVLVALQGAGADFGALNEAGESAKSRARLTGRGEIAQAMEGLEAARERDEIQSELPAPPKERRASL